MEAQGVPQCLKLKGVLHIPPGTTTTCLGLCATRANSTPSHCERQSQWPVQSRKNSCSLPPPIPCQTVQPNPSTARATHHCNSVRALHYLYPNFSCSSRTILWYSCFINTEIQFCHSMNIKKSPNHTAEDSEICDHNFNRCLNTT